MDTDHYFHSVRAEEPRSLCFNNSRYLCSRAAANLSSIVRTSDRAFCATCPREISLIDSRLTFRHRRPRLTIRWTSLPLLQTTLPQQRENDALIRTVVSPDGRRVLALYGTADEPGSAFRIDLYNSDGQFIRNLIPPDISCVFPETVTWSPDGNFINFIAHKRVMPSPSPTPPNEPEPEPRAFAGSFAFHGAVVSAGCEFQY